MGADEKRRWKIGGRVSESGRHTCSFAGDLSEAEAEELKVRFAAIHELAELRALGRVIESAGRWGAILDTAETESELDGLVSNRSQRAAWLELNAFVRLGERLVAELREWADQLKKEPEPAARQFDEKHTRLGCTGPHALLVDAFEREGVPPDLLQPRETPDRFFVRGFEIYGAHELIATALGGMIELLVAFFALRDPSYRVLAREMKSMTLSVPEGMPSIFSFVETDDGSEPTQYQMTDFPVPALVRLDRAFDGIVEGLGANAILELFQGRYRRRLSFGEASADSAASGGESSDGINALPSATMKLDVDLQGSEPIDYWAIVRDRVEEAGDGRDMFVGSVQRAVPDGRSVALECEGAATAIEQLAGGTLAANMDSRELTLSLIARSGWAGELTLADEGSEGEPEVFEVLVPLEGIEVKDKLSLGTISIVPRELGLQRISAIEQGELRDLDAEMVAAFRVGDSYALAEPVARMVDQAEERGLAEIDLAVAWLTTRGRYGAVALPDGTPQAFDRRESLRAPRLGAVVLVHGNETERLWLRRPNPPADAVIRHLGGAEGPLLPLPAELEVNDRLALLALRLAASEGDPLMQIRALWQAVESYAEKRKAERKLFDRRERKAIMNLLLEEGALELNDRQIKRLEDAVKNLNHEPLTARLERRLKQDAVLVTDRELALLQKLYDVRNDIVHGRSVDDPPQRDEVNYGISIVARMLVHRIAGLGPN